MSWPIVTLDDLKASEPRAITDGPFGSNLARQHYTDSGPRVVRLQNIGDGCFIDAEAHISPSHFETLKAHEVLPGDLLVASLGETLPRACLAPRALGPAIVKADCIRVRLSQDVDHKWVMYSLQRPRVRRWADEHRHGVGRPRLGLKVIRQIPVPLPPLVEQLRIVEILEDHLSRLDAANDYLAAARRRTVSLRKSALEGLLGKSEEHVPLGELVSHIEAGKSFGSANRRADEDEWGIVKVSAMTWGEFRPEENKAVPADKVDLRYEIRRGDLLVSRANTSEYVGASVLVPEVRKQLLLSDKSLRVVPRPDVDAEWLWRALQSPSARRQISALATGTKDSMRNISQKSLLRVQLPQVAHADQRVAVAAYRSIDDTTRDLARAVESAEVRRSALQRAVLASAFSGRLTGHRTDDEVIEELAQ